MMPKSLHPATQANIEYAVEVCHGDKGSSFRERAKAELTRLVKTSHDFDVRARFLSEPKRKLWTTFQRVQRGGFDL